MRRTATALVLAAVAVLAASSTAAAADWPIYGRDLSNSRDAGGAGPTLAQASTLTQAWSFQSSSGDFTGTPVVANGVLVAGDNGGTVYALDAVTGKLRWSRKVGGPINGSAAIDLHAPQGPTVYVPLAVIGGPRMLALSLRDGHTRWNALLTGQAGSDVYGSPVPWHGNVYIGTSGPNGDASSARGTVVALKAATGAVRWRRFTVPPGHDGGAVWSTAAIDTATGRLYVGTGNAYHAPAAGTTDAILALDATTGAILAHYQATGGDVFTPSNPTGADADFGASPNLITGPQGGALVGEGAKDGTYRTVRRASMKLVWNSNVGPGSGIGGVVGSTAYDGKRIYGSNAATSQVWALGRDGLSNWTSVDGGTLDFSPVATGNGVLYSATNAGFLTARNAATGMVLNTFSLGGPTFGGMSLVGRAVYVSVGLGPPPPPAPQQSGSGSIVAFGDTSRSGAPAKISLSVDPRDAPAGRSTTFHFVARARSAPLAGAVVHFAGHDATTDGSGRAQITARLTQGDHTARATKAGFRAGSVVVHAHESEHEH